MSEGYSFWSDPSFVDPRATITPRVGMLDLLGAEFAQSYHDSPVVTMFRAAEKADLGDAEMSPLLSPDEAKRRFGVDTGDHYMTEAQVSFIAQDQRKTEERLSMISRKSGLLQGIGGFAAQAAGFTADPLNLAITTIPFVGEERYAQLLYGFSKNEAVLKAGLSTAAREGLAGVGPTTAARAVSGAAGAGAGFTLLEPFNYLAAKADGRDYDSSAALNNILLGSVIGAGMHVTLGALGDIAESPEARTARIIEINRAIAGDEVPNFEYIHALDPARIYSEVQKEPDLVAMRQELAAIVGDKETERTPTYQKAVEDRVAERQNEIVERFKQQELAGLKPSLLDPIDKTEIKQPRTENPNNPVPEAEKAQAQEKMVADAEQLTLNLPEEVKPKLENAKAEIMDWTEPKPEIGKEKVAPGEASAKPEGTALTQGDKAQAIQTGLDCFLENLTNA